MATPGSPAASTRGERAVTIAMVGALAVYAVWALLTHRWLSGLVAPLVAMLLGRRHPRARFAAYVFFSALAFRSVVSGAWPLAVFALAGIAVLQTAPARRAWPRLVAGRPASTRPGDCSRMNAP